jgi:ATP-dependent HslUV protease ATP-binding subunit HslU
MVEEEQFEAVHEEARRRAVERLVDAMAPDTRELPDPAETPPHVRAMHDFAVRMGLRPPDGEPADTTPPPRLDPAARAARRADLARRLNAGELADELVEIDVEESRNPVFNVWGGQGEELIRLEDALGGMMPKQTRHRRLTVAEALDVLTRDEAQKLVDRDRVIREAVERAENDGIVFVDEIDKIAGGDRSHGPDVSREGVQRDILPVVEGTTVMTKYGPVDTRHMLFIAAGAFHMSKPSDLIPELQGRFPIRVELESLAQVDLRRILAEPEHSLLRQYEALLATEGVTLEFQDEAVDELATIAMQVNDRTENIGARRLHTILENLLEELSFAAPDIGQTTVVITREYVRQRLTKVVEDEDLSRFIL